MEDASYRVYIGSRLAHYKGNWRSLAKGSLSYEMQFGIWCNDWCNFFYSCTGSWCGCSSPCSSSSSSSSATEIQMYPLGWRKSVCSWCKRWSECFSACPRVIRVQASWMSFHYPQTGSVSSYLTSKPFTAIQSARPGSTFPLSPSYSFYSCELNVQLMAAFVFVSLMHFGIWCNFCCKEKPLQLRHLGNSLASISPLLSPKYFSSFLFSLSLSLSLSRFWVVFDWKFFFSLAIGYIFLPMVHSFIRYVTFFPFSFHTLHAMETSNRRKEWAQVTSFTMVICSSQWTSELGNTSHLMGQKTRQMKTLAKRISTCTASGTLSIFSLFLFSLHILQSLRPLSFVCGAISRDISS